MNQLTLIIKNEVRTDISSKSFWLSTLLVPVAMLAFGGFFGYLAAQSDTAMDVQENIAVSPDPESLTAVKVAGMVIGMFLTFFIMICGAMIFNKVKTEKCNRIMEILSTCVDGRTMMFAKIISVGIIGLIQMMVWGALIFIGLGVMLMVFPTAIPWEIFTDPTVWLTVVYTILYFFGGYVLFGSLYAACGAITDKDNENQAYMTGLTFLLLGAFYLGQFAVDNGDSALAIACTYIPFTSPTVGTINAVTGVISWWEVLISLVVLYASAAIAVVLSGKLYRSSMLLRGKQFTPKDIITFLRTN